ncbi:hypothetical protein KDK_11350 [Dictyobacter kobayashii]|uniref:Uncharacterized protein n=1 Tax=Dictyobacter kobayashii TaxID=2014872 RepID=A0A402AE14_9CHLR|nr:hypothetical protein KDK_11350 [Dictyobacter kobayashii]
MTVVLDGNHVRLAAYEDAPDHGDRLDPRAAKPPDAQYAKLAIETGYVSYPLDNLENQDFASGVSYYDGWEYLHHSGLIAVV